VVRLAFDRPGELRSLENVGRVTVEEIRRHVRELAEGGYDGYLYRGPRPESLAETVAAILAVDDGEGGILRERFYEGRTLTQISEARSISRQWTCLLISRAIGRARVRFSDVLSPQLSPVLADAEARGGLLDCHALDGLRPGEIRLALKVAGHEGWSDRGDGFLVRDRAPAV
jgi:hypothetical protein